MGAKAIGGGLITYKIQYVGLFCDKCRAEGETCNVYNVQYVASMAGVSKEDYIRNAKRSIISCEGCIRRIQGLYVSATGVEFS